MQKQRLIFVIFLILFISFPFQSNAQQKLSLQQKASLVIQDLNSQDLKTKQKAIQEIKTLCYQNLKTEALNQSVPILINMLKEELGGQKVSVFIEGKPVEMAITGPKIETIQALGAIGDKSALPILEEIAKKGPKFSSIDGVMTEAGYAQVAINTIKAKKDFLDKLKDKTKEEKIDFLINEIKNRKYLSINEVLFLNLIIDSFVEIGRIAIPALTDLVNQALRNDRDKTNLFYTPTAYIIVSKVLEKIGSINEIPILEKIINEKKDTGYVEFAIKAIKKIRNRNTGELKWGLGLQ
jgi:HEAT repeat protein